MTLMRRYLFFRRAVLSRANVSTALVLASLAAAFPITASGQAVKVAQGRARPNLVVNGLSISAAPLQVNFSLAAGKAVVGDSPVNITTNWGVAILSTINLYGYFTNASGALTGDTGSASIPSSAVFGQMTTGLPASYTAFTQTSPVGGAGASLELFSQPILLSLQGSRVDALNLKIDLSSLPTLPADTYRGTLVLQAEAF